MRLHRARCRVMLFWRAAVFQRAKQPDRTRARDGDMKRELSRLPRVSGLSTLAEIYALMPKHSHLKSILIIGAGPIVIGQACEFDYSGTQACKALREEGYSVILVNSNPAT